MTVLIRGNPIPGVLVAPSAAENILSYDLPANEVIVGIP
jgi:hypothetical protein